MKDSIVFNKGLYEIIKELPQDMQNEIYKTIMDYVFYDVEPDNSNSIIRGLFLLMKSQIDADNQKKKKKGKENEQIAENNFFNVKETETENDDKYKKAIFEKLKKDTIWKEQGVCMQFHLKLEDVDKYIDKFYTHCISVDRVHNNLRDAKYNFTNWLRIQLEREEKYVKKYVKNENKEPEIEAKKNVMTEKNEKLLESSDTEYRGFLVFVKRRASYCFNEMEMPTEIEYHDLRDKIGEEKMRLISQDISVKKQFHGKWDKLYIAIQEYG